MISVINAQIDLELCPNGSSHILDSKWRTIPSRFEIMTEMVINNEAIELSQAFSTQRDTIITNSLNGPIRIYWNFLTNEQFIVSTNIIDQQLVLSCFRQVIEPKSQTSLIQSNTNYVKPSILLGFDSRNQINTLWGIEYDGDEILRGIPTNRFKSCFYVNDIDATISAIYHVSDVTKFQSYLSANESIILQIDVEIKNRTGYRESYKYNVFRYSPNPNRREERQTLETPAGIFCPNRTNTLSVPSNIPERVSSNSEAFIASDDISIFSSRDLYDAEFQFTHSHIWFPIVLERQRLEHLSRIHDFAVGLSYEYDYRTGRCEVEDLSPSTNDVIYVDEQSNLVQMSTPQHLFFMDDITYQYTGEKRCRDRVWCHVWIGKKLLEDDLIQYREWYWASNVNDVPLQQWIPMKMVSKVLYTNGTLLDKFETTMFNYRTNPMTVFDIEHTLANCYRALGPAENFNLGVLTFKIANEKNYSVLQNINYLRVHVFETLIFTLFIRPIRISHLIIDQDDNDIMVTFTLLDAPPRTGPVENPLNETSLDILIERLNSIIDSNGLAFRAKYGTKQVVLRARTKSLNIYHRTTQEIVKTTGPRITGLWVSFILIGLIVGIISAYFVFQRLGKR